MFEAYLAALVGVMLAQAAPGPNFLAVVSAALGQGRRAALWTVLGVATGMLIWAAAVAFGLAVLLALYPVLLVAMKIVGGGYLLFMGWHALMAAWRGGAVSVKADRKRFSDGAAWRRGLLVVITNPKAALMWSAVGAFLFGSGLTGWQVAAFGPFAAISAVLIYGTYGLLFSSGLAARTYARISRWIEAALGSVFAALGGTLLLNGLRDAGARG